ncbi:MAG: hypothetical protein H6709_09105 [Kofleriaceae bacterium]|nr:hypothetical protein [Myxococcales bacterium]MCB9563302.1 hypothetical protein [Kofleriaceae bacterium]MCB9572228.1 hypothetical protein [Kofleriaceae bacterium]
MTPRCPLCAGELGPDAVPVCGACHRRALGPVRTTAEFAVPMVASAVPEPAPPPPSADTCSWCGKAGAEVKKLLGNGAVAICDGCVALCADVLDAELGDGWRG